MKAVDNGTRMVFVGDSLVNGAGDDATLGWAGRLCQEARSKGEVLTYYNLGVRGDTSAAILLRWQRELRWRVPKGEPCKLIFSFGINDMALSDGEQNIATEASIENMGTILKAAKATGEVLMVSPTPVLDKGLSERIKDLTEQQGAFCKHKKILFLDLYSPLLKAGSYLQDLEKGDGYHPSAAGYAEIAKVIGGSEVWWF